MKDNVLIQWIVLVLAVKAGFLVLEVAASYLPDVGIFGAMKAVISK